MTADSLVSGNVKDVLTNFFQLSFDRLTGPDKELNFQSNPFAIMLKSDTSLAVDRNYYHYKPLRKLNFGFGLKLDSSYRFNGFSSGFKYALIDHRDSSTSKMLFENIRNNLFDAEIDLLRKELRDHAMTIADLVERKKFNKQTNDFSHSKLKFSELEPSFQKTVKDIVGRDKTKYPRLIKLLDNPSTFSVESENLRIYDSLRAQIKNAFLWTLNLSDTTYKDQFFFSNVLLNTQFLKGVGKPKAGSNWEFDIRLGVNFRDDTLSKARDLKRILFNFEPGINWVLRTKNADKSVLELKLSGKYIHNYAALYKDEKRDVFMLNGTMRFRIIGDVWLPLEIKYEPRSGNVFGFLNIRANFTGLKAVAKNLSN